MVRTKLILPVLCLACWFSLAEAEYVLVLKNGRQITVQSYRTEGSMIMFQGFGGEIGINKDEIQTIRKAGSQEAGGLNVVEPPQSQPSEGLETRQKPATTTPPVAETPLSPEQERAKEERDYQQKLADITEQLKNAQDRYSYAIRGTTSSDPTLLTTEEQLKARQDDIISRSLDAQYKPTDPAGTRLVTPSPFTTLPPTVVDTGPPVAIAPPEPSRLPQYTERQKALSDIRSEMLQLESQRNKLIEEMKQKNFTSGKVFE
jgi:hypothetical protein